MRCHILFLLEKSVEGSENIADGKKSRDAFRASRLFELCVT